MVLPSTGSVVLIRFPFSDLSRSKLRPAVVLADAGRCDWVLCQAISNPFSDSSDVEIRVDDFHTGALRMTSFARPFKRFTAGEGLVTSKVGELESDKFDEIGKAVIRSF